MINVKHLGSRLKTNQFFFLQKHFPEFSITNVFILFSKHYFIFFCFVLIVCLLALGFYYKLSTNKNEIYVKK